MGRSGPPGSGAQASELPFPDVPRIAVADAKSRVDAGEALVVDVRGASDFEAEHIPGAVSVPLAGLAGRMSELPRNAEIITYCT